MEWWMILVLVALAFLVRLVFFRRHEAKVMPQLEYVEHFNDSVLRIAELIENAPSQSSRNHTEAAAVQRELLDLQRKLKNWSVPNDLRPYHESIQGALAEAQNLWQADESEFNNAREKAYQALGQLLSEFRRTFPNYPLEGIRSTNLGAFLFGFPKPIQRPTQDVPNQTQGYWSRARERMEEVIFETERIDALFSQNGLDDHSLRGSSLKLRQLAEEQRMDVVPDPALQQHQRDYFRLMDLQARKVEDFLATGGANLASIQREEMALSFFIDDPGVDEVASALRSVMDRPRS